MPPTQLIAPRLLLRPFTLSDAKDVQTLAGDESVAFTTLTIPHPYQNGLAEAWIKGHAEAFANGTQFNFAIVLREAVQPKAQHGIVGCVSLIVDKANSSAELGYWIGRPYWNKGFMTEAANAIIRYGFACGLNRITAKHFSRNPASGRVMQKVGMLHEGCARQLVQKCGVFEDCEIYAILRCDYSGE